MRAFGARGFVSQEQLNRTKAFVAARRAERNARERSEIAALSNLDIQKIMARKIVEAAAARGSVSRYDFVQAGIPEHRIDKNRDAAFRLARRQEPKLDAMGAQQ
jgi:hypothetical protein